MQSKNDPLDSICTKCGACLSVCPVYDIKRHERFSPRGRERLLRGLISKPSRSIHPKILETLEECLQCGACSAICQSGVDVCALVRKARGLYPGKVSRVEKGLEVMSNTGLRPLIHTIASKIPPRSDLFQRIMGIPRKDSFIPSLLLKTPALLDERVMKPRSMSSHDKTPRIAFFWDAYRIFFFPKQRAPLFISLMEILLHPRNRDAAASLPGHRAIKPGQKNLSKTISMPLTKPELI
jgi:ferredoxin